MHAAHVFFIFYFFYIDAPCSTPLIDTLNLLPPFPTPLFPLLLSSLTSTVFVWLLGFVCLLFPDGRRRLHLSSFQVPREIFTALAQALILFPLKQGFMMGLLYEATGNNCHYQSGSGEKTESCAFFFSQSVPRLNIAMGESVVEDPPPPS